MRKIWSNRKNKETPVILVITRNLPPLIGGMERLIWHIVDELRKAYKVHVIGPEGSRVFLPHAVSSTEIHIKPMSWYLFITALSSIWQTLIRRPRLVLAGSGLTAPFAWLAARMTGARCIVYLHGLDIKVAHPLYRLLWFPLIRRCDLVLVNSRFTKTLALEAGISAQRINILNPGVDRVDMNEAESQRSDFKARHSLGDAPLLLFVGRITARKGLAVFVRGILPMIVEQFPNTRLVVIGDEAKSAVLKTTGEREHIERLLSINGLRKNVVFLGGCSDYELKAAYFAADVLVFPVQQRPNDIEGFGMVAVEAAAHNLPTVAFSVGGVSDAVGEGVSGILVPPGDNLAFSQAVIDSLRKGPSKSMKNCQSFAARFAWPVFGQRFRELCGLM